MAEKCFPLNDTNYLADDLQMWFAGRTHGVLCLEENLMVTAQKGMKITLHKGHAFLRTGIENKGGVMYFNEANLEFTLDVADSILDRIDNVCIRYDKVENKSYAYIQKGIPSNQPVAMKPKRDAAYFEIVVAQIRIPKGIGEITSLHISDKRMDEEVCGLIKDNIERIPTQILYNQFQSFMDETKKESEDWKYLRDKEYTQWYDAIKELFANRIVDIDEIITTQTDKFNTWFDDIKDVLNDEVAANLLTMIMQNSPVGEIKQFAGGEAPGGYLLCRGQAVDREVYMNLFNVIGTTYGEGDGVNTFNLPNLQGRIGVGLQSDETIFNTLGKTGGHKELQSHTHTATSISAGAHIHTASSNSTGAHTHTVSGTAANAGAHEHGIPTTKSGTQISNGDFWIGGTGGIFNKVSDQSGSHTHSINGTAATNGAHAHTVTIASNGTHTHTVNIANAGVGNGDNIQPYLVINYIIKC